MDAKYLNEQEAARFAALLKLFEQPGWAELVRMKQEQVKYLESQLEFAEDIRDLRYMKGALDTLRSDISYEDQVLAEYESVVASRREEELEIEDSFGANE